MILGPGRRAPVEAPRRGERACSTSEDGYLPEALVNYLARLGWSHGDEEKFSREQLVEWFDLEHISRSPARFDPEKLAWLNAQYLKETDDARLAELASRSARGQACDVTQGRPLAKVVALLKERAARYESSPTRRSISTAPVAAPEELKRAARDRRR